MREKSGVLDAGNNFKTAAKNKSHGQGHQTLNSSTMLCSLILQVLIFRDRKTGRNIEPSLEFDPTLKAYVLDLAAKPNLGFYDLAKTNKAITKYFEELELIADDRVCEISPNAKELIIDTKHDLFDLVISHMKSQKIPVYDMYEMEEVLSSKGLTADTLKSNLDKAFRISSEHPDYEANLLWWTPNRVYLDYKACLATSQFVRDHFQVKRVVISENALLTAEKIRLEERDDPTVKDHLDPGYILN